MKDYKKEFLQCLESIEYGRNSYDLFQDFLTMASLSLQNVIDKDEKLEKEYMNTVNKYGSPSKFSELLGIVTIALTKNMQDFLGSVYMDLGLGNTRTGQFFTPYHLSEMMAKITFSDENYLKQQIEEKGHIILSEPCCGSGGMIIAVSNVLKDKGYNPQKDMKFVGIDIDLKCCQMAFIQTSLLGLRGEILYGNTLSLEIWNRFITPMSYLPLAA